MRVVAEKGSAEFYREQAIRITAIAVDTADNVSRLQLLEIAAAFQRLADRAVALRDAPYAAKSA